MASEPNIFCIDCGYPLDASASRRCPECGKAFDPDDCTSYAVDAGDLVKLYASANPLDAYLLRDTLIAEGIPAVVIGEMLTAARGELPLTGDTLPSVWVGQADAERATQIAVSFDAAKGQRSQSTAPTQTWNCPECGEEVEGHFESCWNCGAVKPGLLE